MDPLDVVVEEVDPEEAVEEEAVAHVAAAEELGTMIEEVI
tara:strand:+ start:245 stop:364 length:120 start_codon:yes stop_codon:yes gene_type:complete